MSFGWYYLQRDMYCMWHTWTCDTQNIFRELNMCKQPISRICGKPDLSSMQTLGNTLGLQVIDDVYCLKFPPYVFVPHVMWTRLNNKLWDLVKAPNSNIQVLVYVLFTVISMLLKVLRLTRSRTRWQALTLKSFYYWDITHFGCWLTHLVEGRSESRNHNKRNLVTVIKQEKGKHGRALMPGHLKCLRSENIFAHKALWWWPCPFQHRALLSV